MIIRDGVFKVISGTLMVMKGTRRNNLYYYNGSTVSGVVAMVSGSDEDLEIILVCGIDVWGMQVREPYSLW